MIKILKLVTGEELVGDVKDNENTVSIDRPCYIQIVPSRTNPEQPAMALVPYAAYTKQHRVEIKKEFIVWDEEPMKELYNQYNTIFGSGLVVPT